MKYRRIDYVMDILILSIVIGYWTICLLMATGVFPMPLSMDTIGVIA